MRTKHIDMKGKNESETLKGNYTGVDYTRDVVEVDLTPLDIMIGDSQSGAIGRPTLRVLVDKHSRLVRASSIDGPLENS